MCAVTIETLCACTCVLEKSFLCVCLAHVVSVESWREADRGPGLPHAVSGVSVPGNPQEAGRNKDPALLQRACVVAGAHVLIVAALRSHCHQCLHFTVEETEARGAKEHTEKLQLLKAQKAG